jgi:glycosyltransferase involved in cell wall biosynthesis
MPKILILYSELAEYTIACLRALKKEHVELMLVHWPINKEAPFQFDLSFVDHLHARDTLSDAQLLSAASGFNPDLVLCSGWMDKGYVAVCKAMRPSAVTVLSMDNHWTGKLKQQIASWVSPFTLKKAFSKAFVPGQVQKLYALKLGFTEQDIQTGFYSADTPKFNAFYDDLIKAKSSIPKRFLYLGRYVKHKGIFELWEAFNAFRKEHPEWELWCVGTGDEFQNTVEADGIKHFGFKQPSELLPILKDTGVYILPSHFEPWGVSVQEMAIAGFPLLLSDKIGSKEAYLKDAENGFEFQSGSVYSLQQAMVKVANLSQKHLMDMAQQSHKLGIQNSPQIWVSKLLSFLPKHG